MARKRQGVTFENANDVHGYFFKLLESYNWRDSGSIKTTGDFSKDIAAKEQFDQIKTYPSCDIGVYERALKRLNNSIEKKRSEETIKQNESALKYAQEGQRNYDNDLLEKWVLSFVTDKGWSRCLANIRQKKYSLDHRYETKQIKINRSLSERLESLAEGNGKSIDELLRVLLDNAPRIKELKFKEF